MDSQKRKKDSSKIGAKKFKSNKFKPATQEELNQLQESSSTDLTDSVLSLQIENILKNFKLATKYENFISQWMESFTQFLTSLRSETDKKLSTDIKWLKKNLVLPLNNEKFNLPTFYFQFLTPTSIRFTGSKILSTLQTDNINIDIAVEMPAKSFQKEDYLNTIYDQKKAMYLSYIALRLRKSDLQSNLAFTYHQQDVLRPVLKVTANAEFKKSIILNIYVIAEKGKFKLSRFVPWNNNIRDGLLDSNPSDSNVFVPTPHYNMSVMRDLTTIANDNFLTETIKGYVNVSKGIALFKLWLKARCLNDNFCGFSGHIVSMFAAYLLKNRKLNISMSVFDVIRSIFLNLKFSKWHKKGISIEQTTDPIEKYHDYFDVVFMDSTGCYNVCSNLLLDIYLRTVEESGSALTFLDAKNVNNFRYLFILDMNPHFQFDHILHVNEYADIDTIIEDNVSKADKNDYAGYWYPLVLKLFSSLLRKGLDNRIHSLTPLSTTKYSWSITETCPKMEKTISFGLKLNAENCLEILNKGPQANQADAEVFKAFWGNKSELRRFQDGNITETCVWANPSDKLVTKRLITRDICLYLLNYHYKINPGHINYMASQFDLAYRVSGSFTTLKDDFTNSEHLALDVIRSFDDLAKKLRSLDVELDVTSVLGSSAVFRYCEIHPILTDTSAFNNGEIKVFLSHRTNEGIIELSASGKWPDNLDGIKYLKAAFCLKMAKQMNEKFQLQCRGNVDSIEVVQDGYLFRLKLLVRKELALIEEMPNRKSDILPMEMEYLLPKLNVALHSLYMKTTCFGPAVLIAKRWFYSQLLDPFLWPDVCTELLMAYIFMEDKSFEQPIQPQSAFFRFLELLRRTDWQSQIFILNFNEELQDADITDLENKFKFGRNSYPPLAIITSYDTKRNSMWSKMAPSVEILSRVTVLSNHAIQLIEENMFRNAFTTKIFFKPSYDGYNVLLKIRKNVVQTSHAYDFFKNFKKGNQVKKVTEPVPAADYNPVDYFLRDVRMAYGDVAIFFYNPCAGDTIAVIWTPKIFESSEFEVSNINGRKYAGRNKYVYNLRQIIEDFRIIGRGLIENIVECE